MRAEHRRRAKPVLVGWMVHGGKLILVFISPLWLWSRVQINRGRRGAVVFCMAVVVASAGGGGCVVIRN